MPLAVTLTSLSPGILKLEPNRQKLRGRAPGCLGPATQPGPYLLPLITSCQLSPRRRGAPGFVCQARSVGASWTYLPVREGVVPQQARWHLRLRWDRVPGAHPTQARCLSAPLSPRPGPGGSPGAGVTEQGAARGGVVHSRGGTGRRVLGHPDPPPHTRTEARVQLWRGTLGRRTGR